MLDDETAPSINCIDNPLAPEFFADGVMGIQNLGGLLRVTFESWRFDDTSFPHHRPINRVCAGRLVMTPAAAELMANSILNVLAQQQTQTVEPNAAGPMH